MVLNNASLRRVDGNIALPTFSMTLGLDADSWTWSFSASLPGRALSDLEPASSGAPVEVEALINGVAFRALVESIERSREFGKSDLRITGRGKTALLDARSRSAKARPGRKALKLQVHESASSPSVMLKVGSAMLPSTRRKLALFKTM